LLDRIDIHIEVPRVDYEKLSGDRVGESSACIRARVQAVRDIQNQRFSSNGSSDIVCNADMRVGEIRQYCKLPEDGQSLMRAAMSQLNLSARAYHRILKLARTIADLAGNEEIESVHLAEALHASQPAEVDLELASYLSSNYSSLRLRAGVCKAT
jgi:magnesium chelatase family protein